MLAGLEGNWRAIGELMDQKPAVWRHRCAVGVVTRCTHLTHMMRSQDEAGSGEASKVMCVCSMRLSFCVSRMDIGSRSPVFGQMLFSLKPQARKCLCALVGRNTANVRASSCLMTHGLGLKCTRSSLILGSVQAYTPYQA